MPPTNSLESSDKKRLARIWREKGLTLTEIGDRLGITKARVCQILKEPEAVEPEDDDALPLGERYLKARTELTEKQTQKLARQLELEAGNLIRADAVEEILKSLLRHYKAQADWIRKHRIGDDELLAAHSDMLKATLKECQQRGWLEGEGIDNV